jgi:hypothetical protein
VTDTHARVRCYDVSVWPDEIECMDSETWKLTVEYRGHDLWSVSRGHACLNADEEWDWEMRPSERDDEWLTSHRFSLQKALLLAEKHAPDVTINGMTATEVLERHRQRHPDGNCGG